MTEYSSFALATENRLRFSMVTVKAKIFVGTCQPLKQNLLNVAVDKCGSQMHVFCNFRATKKPTLLRVCPICRCRLVFLLTSTKLFEADHKRHVFCCLHQRCHSGLIDLFTMVYRSASGSEITVNVVHSLLAPNAISVFQARVLTM